MDIVRGPPQEHKLQDYGVGRRDVQEVKDGSTESQSLETKSYGAR
jgi:hypothetical protein